MVSAIASLTATALPAFLTGALAVQIREDLGFSASRLGLAVAAFYLFSALGSLHAGELSDRIGPRRALLLANGASAVCLLAIALLARSFGSLLVILTLGSAGLMIAGPATKVLVARAVPPAKHGLAFGIQMSAIPLAALLGGLAVPVVGQTLGWRWAFAGAALVPVLGAVTLPRSATAPPPATAPRARRFGHIEFGPLVILGTASVLGSAAATTMASFFVVTGTDVGFSEGVAGGLLSGVSAFVIVLRIVFGSMADRFESAHPQTVTGLFLLSSLGYVGLMTEAKALFPVGALVALAFGWAWTGLMVFAVVRHYPHAPGLASSTIVGGLNLGSVLGPLAFGAVLDHLSTGVAFGMAGGWSLAAAWAAFAGTARLGRRPAPPTPGPLVIPATERPGRRP